MISSGQAKANSKNNNKLYMSTLNRFYDEIEKASKKGDFSVEVSFTSKDQCEYETLKAVCHVLETDGYATLTCSASVIITWY